MHSDEHSKNSQPALEQNRAKRKAHSAGKKASNSRAVKSERCPARLHRRRTLQLLRQLADLSLPRATLHRRVSERWESGPIKTGRAQIVIAHGCQATGQQTTPPRRRQKRPRSSCSRRRPAAFKKRKTAACPSEETLMHTRGWRRDDDEAHDPKAGDAAQQRNPFVPQNTLHEEPELPSRSSRLSPDPRNHRAPHPPPRSLRATTFALGFQKSGR